MGKRENASMTLLVIVIWYIVASALPKNVTEHGQELKKINEQNI